MKLIDYLYSEEGQMYMAWGVEGVTYEYGPDGKPQFTDYTINHPDGLGVSDVLRTVGAWPTVHWVQRQDVYLDLAKDIPEFKNSATMLAPYYKVSHFVVDGTAEEQEEQSLILGDLDTYRAEQIINFVTGARPIEEYDMFIEELKAMGMERAEAIEQREIDLSSRPISSKTILRTVYNH